MEKHIDINKKLSLVPHNPGCYLMKDKNDEDLTYLTFINALRIQQASANL